MMLFMQWTLSLGDIDLFHARYIAERITISDSITNVYFIHAWLL